MKHEASRYESVFSNPDPDLFIPRTYSRLYSVSLVTGRILPNQANWTTWKWIPTRSGFLIPSSMTRSNFLNPKRRAHRLLAESHRMGTTQADVSNFPTVASSGYWAGTSVAGVFRSGFLTLLLLLTNRHQSTLSMMQLRFLQYLLLVPTALDECVFVLK